jgi:hypothetical protein
VREDVATKPDKRLRGLKRMRKKKQIVVKIAIVEMI